jgi:ribosomal protein L7/L12
MNNYTAQDILDNYHEGYLHGKEAVLKLIREATGLDFKEPADLVMYLRNNTQE